jgi:hypothetical protein
MLSWRNISIALTDFQKGEEKRTLVQSPGFVNHRDKVRIRKLRRSATTVCLLEFFGGDSRVFPRRTRVGLFKTGVGSPSRAI